MAFLPSPRECKCSLQEMNQRTSEQQISPYSRCHNCADWMMVLCLGVNLKWGSWQQFQSSFFPPNLTPDQRPREFLSVTSHQHLQSQGTVLDICAKWFVKQAWAPNSPRMTRECFVYDNLISLNSEKHTGMRSKISGLNASFIIAFMAM